MSKKRERKSFLFTRPYRCTVEDCTKSYPSQQALNQHFKLIHVDKHTITCPDCNQMCHSKQGLAYHRRYCHKDENKKYYNCTYSGCSKYYAYNFDLCKHIRTCHDPSYKKKVKQRRFLCSVEGCGKSFFRADNLRQHNENVHMDKACKITCKGYHCWDCSVVCKRWTDLLKHRRLEHPKVYTCANCDDVFRRKRELTIHVQLHRDPHMKIYYCTFKNCKKIYATESGKNYHVENVHRRYYICHHLNCGEKFISKISLQLHVKQHVKKEPDVHEEWEDQVTFKKDIDDIITNKHNIVDSEVHYPECTLNFYKKEEDKENNSSLNNSNIRNNTEKIDSGFECETFFNENNNPEIQNTNTDILHDLYNFLSHDAEADAEVMENILQQCVFNESDDFTDEDRKFDLFEENDIDCLGSMSETVKPDISTVTAVKENDSVSEDNFKKLHYFPDEINKIDFTDSSVQYKSNILTERDKVSNDHVRKMSTCTFAVQGKASRKLGKLLMVARRYYNTIFEKHDS